MRVTTMVDLLFISYQLSASGRKPITDSGLTHFILSSKIASPFLFALGCTRATGDGQFNNENIHRGVAQLARAPALGAGSRTFKSCHPDHPSLCLTAELRVAQPQGCVTQEDFPYEYRRACPPVPVGHGRVSYSGYYATLPRLRGGFDSRYPLQAKPTRKGRFCVE
jgi:hypothetical protein